MLSNTSKYAIRAVIYLALHSANNGNRKVGQKEIAEQLNIPSPFLGKILQMLVKQGLLLSVKGPHGGFTLARSSMEISLMDIVEIIDGTDVFDKCLIRTSSCSKDAPCSLHHKISPARGELRSILNSESIADLASEFLKGNEKIRI